MELNEAMEVVSEGFEVVGVGIIVIGGVHTLIRSFGQGLTLDAVYEQARRRFGRALILGLEVLVAADIIQTITIDPSLESIAALGLLVLIRVVLSFSLDVEVDGMVPWMRVKLDREAP